MHKPTAFVLLGALILAAVGAVVVPQLLTDPEPPVLRWSEADEQDVPDEDAAAKAAAEDGGALIERTEVASAEVPDDRGDRIDVTLRGRVIDRFQAPVGQAMVWLDFGRGGPGGRTGPANRQRRVPEPVQTDAEGRFAFQGQTFRNLRVSLQVAHPNFAPGLFNQDVGTVVDGVDLGDLVLHNGGEVRGRVTDLAGNGIADAELRAQPENGNALRQLRDRDKLLSPLRTDQNGYFRGQHLAAGDWSLTATAKRHTEGRSPQFAIEADQAVDIDDIRLGPGYEITGTVRDVAGKPVAKATVVAQAEGRNRQGGRGQNQGGGGPGGEHRATTAADGTFLLEHLPGTPLRIDADAAGYLDLRVEGIDPTLGAPLNLTLQDGLRIEGVVQDTDARPVTRFAYRAVRLRNLPLPGAVAVDVEALMARLRDPNLSDAERGELRAQMGNQMGNLRDTFGGRGGQTGRGNRGGDDEQRPGRGGGGGGGGGDLGKIESHPGGEFVATGLQEGVFELHLQAPDHARYRSAEFELRAGAAPPRLTVIVDAGVYVAGVVLDDSDRPVANAQVELRVPSAFEGMGRRGRPGNAQAGNGGASTNEGRPDFTGMARDAVRQFAGAQLVLETTTDAEGEFVIKHVARGTYRLRAQARRHAAADSEPFELLADRSGMSLRLGSLGGLFGTVRGLATAEIATARVAAVPMGGQGGGIGAMFGRGRGGPGGGGGGGGGGGNPFQGVEVAADGSYRIDELVPGDYLVRSWIGSPQELIRELMPRFTDGTLTADISVRAGEPTRLDLQVTRPRLGTVAGTVMHNGAPAKGFQVELVRSEDVAGASGDGGGGGGGGRGRGGPMGNFGRSLQATVAGSGTFQITNVAEGAYRLRLQSSRRGGVLHEEVVQVVADLTTERMVSVQTHALAGTVTCDDGTDPTTLNGRVSLLPGLNEPPENLQAWMRGNPSFDTRLQAGGFRFDTLAAGSYLLVLNVPRRERTTLPVVVSGNQQLSVGVGKVSESTPNAPPTPRQPNQNNR